MSIERDYFYRMSSPVRVLASKLTDRNGRVQAVPSEEIKLPGLPYGMDRDELISYAYDEYGVVLSKKCKVPTLVAEIYALGSGTYE